MPVVTASAKGRIVIPRDIREKLDISPGKKLMVRVERDQVVLTPMPDHTVSNFRNFLDLIFEGQSGRLEFRKPRHSVH